MLAISLLLSCIFSGALICSFIWAIVCQVPQVFSLRGLRLYFPTELWVVRSVTWPTSCCLTGQLQLCLPCSTIRHLTGLAAVALPRVLSARLPVSALPMVLDEGFFISLVVGLPYNSIFCPFWLFYVFKLLSFFWLCEEAQCVYLRLHLGQKSNILRIKSQPSRPGSCI